MTVRRNMVLTSIVIAIALIIGLSRLAYWPAWLEVALIAVIGAGGLLVAVRQPDGPGQSWNASPVSEVAPDPPPVEYQREPLTDVRLSSNRADYSFRLAATVWWLPITAAERNAAGLSGLAINDIVRRAGELTRQEDPADCSQAMYKLSRVLSELLSDATRQVKAMAESVQLSLPEQDQRRLDRLATIRKDEEVWEYERRHEQNKRNYLSTDVLKDPGSAVVWWLARNDDQLEKAVANITLFTQLSHAVNDANAKRNGADGSGKAPTTAEFATAEDHTNGQQQPADSAVRRFEDFVGSLGIPPGTDDHILFRDQVARLVAIRGHQTVADEMTQKSEVSDGRNDSADNESNPPTGVDMEPP